MLPLRLVLDTNIIVSAAIKPDGLQRTVLLLAMSRPARFRKGLRQQLLRRLQDSSHLISYSRQLHVTTDPDDNIFLECADAARADYLVTGNQRHFPKFWKQTKIVTSREFITLIAPHLVP